MMIRVRPPKMRTRHPKHTGMCRAAGANSPGPLALNGFGELICVPTIRQGLWWTWAI